MLQNLAAPYFAPFTLALVVLVGLVVIEGLSTVAGKSVSSLLDHLIDHDGDLDADGHLGGVLDWLNAGRVPLLVLLVLLLTWFTATGFALQGVLHAILVPLPAWIAAIVALVIAVPLARHTSRLVTHLVPKDETYALSGDDFVGHTGVVTVGPVRRGVVARMKLKDSHGNWHFPKIEPFDATAEIAEGTVVLVVENKSGVLLVAKAEGSLVQPS
jgi:hypothetical protein